MLACCNNYVKLAVALLELGADVEAKNNVSKVWPGHCMTPGVSREECLEAVSRSIGGLALITHTCTKHNYRFNNAIHLLCTTEVVDFSFKFSCF